MLNTVAGKKCPRERTKIFHVLHNIHHQCLQTQVLPLISKFLGHYAEGVQDGHW